MLALGPEEFSAISPSREFFKEGPSPPDIEVQHT